MCRNSICVVPVPRGVEPSSFWDMPKLGPGSALVAGGKALLGTTRRECRGHKGVDVKGNSVDVKGNSVYVKGNRVDVKGYCVDVKG
eukprot:240950-Prorocentrum_minimum.AAC.1